MNLENNIKLRQQFERFSLQSAAAIKSVSEILKSKYDPDYKINSVGKYIWLSMGLRKREYWSPTLRLELLEENDNRTTIKILYGPDPILWAVFVAIHFILILISIIFAIIIISKWRAGLPIAFDAFVIFVCINIWLLLYCIGRLNKRKGSAQLQQLMAIMEKIIAP